MCVLTFAWRYHGDFPVVIAGNRDEFHERPTESAHWWADHPDLLAGRDLRGGGTWMGLGRNGRFAVVTNVREPGGQGRSRGRSRGELVRDFLTTPWSMEQWAASVSPDDFDGFNLIYGDLHAAHYLSNRDLPSRMLPPGLYGLSNHLLDTPWPKVVRARDGIAGCLDTGAGGVAGMFEVLADTRPAGEDELPSTGVPLEWERRLSPIFISGRDYGTRASTVMLIGADGTARFEERNFGENGRPLESRVFQFRIA